MKLYYYSTSNYFIITLAHDILEAIKNIEEKYGPVQSTYVREINDKTIYFKRDFI